MAAALHDILGEGTRQPSVQEGFDQVLTHLHGKSC